MICTAAGLAAAPNLIALSEQNFTRTDIFRHKVTIAENLVLRLEGKPAMGFVWRLDPDRSSGLELVSVDRLGWSFTAGRGSAAFTKPGVLRYLVVGHRIGKACLVFEYRRKVENASPSAYWTYEVEITP